MINLRNKLSMIHTFKLSKSGKTIISMIILSSMLISGNYFFHTNPTYSMNNGIPNAFSENQFATNTQNISSNNLVSANLTIIAGGITTGTEWDANVGGVNYTSNKAMLNLSLSIGTYTIKFYSYQKWGVSKTVDLGINGATIQENFYRFENLSSLTYGCGIISSTATEGNLTAVVGNGIMDIINQSNNVEECSVYSTSSYSSDLNFVGWSGSEFVAGESAIGWSDTIPLILYNPMNHVLKSDLPVFPDSNLPWNNGYQLSSMAVGHNSVFIAFSDYKNHRNNQYGIYSLTNDNYYNITGDFTSSNTTQISSIYGNCNYIVGIHGNWYNLNGSNMKVTMVASIGKDISPLKKNSERRSGSNYIAYNRTAFLIGNASKILCYNPVRNITKSIYFAKNSSEITAIYANQSDILAGINSTKGIFSLVAVYSNGTNGPIFESTNASASINGTVALISTVGNNMLFAGYTRNGQCGFLDLFTDKSCSGIVFTEQGLQRGLAWYVMIGGLVVKSLGTSIVINNLTNGCYTFYTYSISNFNSSNPYGHIYFIHGLSYNFIIKFRVKFTFVIKNIPMNPDYGHLMVTLSNGLCYLGNFPTYVYSTLNYSGTNISVSPNLECGVYSFYAIHTQGFTKAISGVINVTDNSTVKTLNFVRAKSVISFKLNNNLSASYGWKVDLNSQTFYQTSSKYSNSCSYSFNSSTLMGNGKEEISTTLQDNSYCYSVRVLSNIYGQLGNNVVTGSFSVNGSNLTINITFEMKYPVKVSESGLPMFSEYWWLSEPWQLQINKTDGNFSSSYSSMVWIYNGNVSLCLPNGTYFAKAGTYARNYDPSRPLTYFNVSGAPALVNIRFIPYNYTVTLLENGLSGPYIWYVNTTNGSYSAAAGNPIKIFEINGTFEFNLSSNDKNEIAKQYLNYASVAGSNLTINVNFVRAQKLTITESGLPAHFKWYFNITDQKPLCSTNSTTCALYPNGTFSFTSTSGSQIFSTSGMASHSVSISGNTSFDIFFKPYTYDLVFALFQTAPSIMNFRVILQGGYNDTTLVASSDGTSTVNFKVQNGTYSYKAINSNKNYKTITGTTRVCPYNCRVTLSFSYYLYKVTFVQNGLNHRSNWYIDVINNGAENFYYSLGFNTIEIMVHNGSYRIYAFSGLKNYFPQMNNNISMNPSVNTITIEFYSTPVPGGSEFPSLFSSISSSFYGGILPMMAIGGVTGSIYYLRRKFL
ncbi:MAG: hypothetical protein ACYCR7_02575 [Thermoplasmataceae archaeon]